MNNWIRVGQQYINLNQVISIATDEKRSNYNKPWQSGYMKNDEYVESGYPVEPCVVFSYAVAVSNDDGVNEVMEIRFFDQDRQRLIKWLNETTDIMELPII